MRHRDTGISSSSFFSWTTRFSRDLRKEINAIHIRGLDRAFMATKKGMLYAPVEKLRDSKSEWREKH